ncbi:hypothetical protein GCM10028820_07530 [Tessaracoccus terricola]
MEEQTQRGSSDHLAALTATELTVAREQLAQAGRVIEELRADAIALATRVDEARSEAEALRVEAETARQEAAAESDEVDRLRAQVTQFEAHVARLKQQIQAPGKLMVKKALRRGQFKPDAS